MNYEMKMEIANTADEAERREKILNYASELCLAYKRIGFHCSESAIRACSEALDLRLPEDVIRCAAGFMGGGGSFGDRCGILEAGCMIISYLYGRLNINQEIWRNNYLIRVLHRRYGEEMCSIYCRDILEREIGEGIEDKNTCNHTFDAGARIIVQLIMDAEKLLDEIPAEELEVDKFE